MWVGSSALPSGQEASGLSASGCLSPGATDEQRMVFFMVESVDGLSWGGQEEGQEAQAYSTVLQQEPGT